jgi:hypothetical protein
MNVSKILILIKKMNNVTISKLCKVIASYQNRPSHSHRWRNNPSIKCLELRINTSPIVDCQNSGESFYTGTQYPIEHYAIQLNDIVIDKQLNVGLVLTLPDLPVLTNQNQYIVRVGYSNYLPEYVACYLSRKTLKHELRGKLKLGVLTVETLKGVSIPALPVEEQQKVIEVFKQVRHYKELAQKAIDKMELIPDAVINQLSRKTNEV